MATISLWQKFSVQIGSITYTGGDTTTAQTISAAGNEALDKNFSVATSTTLALWTAGSPELADFDFMWLESNAAIWVELTTDNNGSLGDEPWTIQLTANIPLILSRDDSYANYTVNFGGGTIDVVDRIRVRNLTGSTATGRLFLAT